MTKELTFNDRLWQGSTVECNEIALPSPAPFMQQACRNIFSSSGFSCDQHIDLCVCDMAQCFAQILHCRGLANQRQGFIG